MMELFQKISIIDIRLGSKYASEFEYYFKKSKNCFAI